MIGINGFGRIGKNILRQTDLVSEINQPNCSLEEIFYMIKFDTLLGTFNEVELIGDELFVRGHKINVYFERNLQNIPWTCQIVIDCSGQFRTLETLEKHFNGKVQNVILSAPPKDQMPTIINGFNLWKNEPIISAGSCTTNCLIPLLDVFDKNFGIKTCHFLTVHAVTNSQSVIDHRHQKDKRLGRDAHANIIPTSTGASGMVDVFFPHLTGKIRGNSVRVPVENGSFLEVYLEVEKDLEREEVIDLLKNHEVIKISPHPLVSSDIKTKNEICLIDLDLIKIYDKKRINLGVWYNNEGGYVHQLLEIVRKKS